MAAGKGKGHNYDLRRGLKIYDVGGSLPARAAALWQRPFDDVAAA